MANYEWVLRTKGIERIETEADPEALKYVDGYAERLLDNYEKDILTKDIKELIVRDVASTLLAKTRYSRALEATCIILSLLVAAVVGILSISEDGVTAYLGLGALLLAILNIGVALRLTVR